MEDNLLEIFLWKEIICCYFPQFTSFPKSFFVSCPVWVKFTILYYLSTASLLPACDQTQSFFLLIIGRLFDGQVLDMAEFGVDKFVSMHEIKVICPHLSGTI